MPISDCRFKISIADYADFTDYFATKIIIFEVLNADKTDTVSIGGIQKAAAYKHSLKQGD